MSKSFKYYSDWRNEIVECPKCGWKGRAQDGKERCFSELLDICCPRCVPHQIILAIVSYPTHEQVRAAAKAGHPEAIRALHSVEYTESRNARFDREKLKNPNELPDIEGNEDLDFLLDTVEHSADHDGESWNLIELGDRIIWRELAFWEGYQRFPELVQLLRRKYGTRFKRLRASYLAETYLRGDAWDLPFGIERA